MRCCWWGQPVVAALVPVDVEADLNPQMDRKQVLASLINSHKAGLAGHVANIRRSADQVVEEKTRTVAL